MKYAKYLKNLCLLSSAALAFGLYACGDDSSTSSSGEKAPTSSAATGDSTATSSPSENNTPGDTTSTPAPNEQPVPSTPVITETTSSTEALLPAKNIINGSCAPETESLSLKEDANGNKKALATWVFSRTAGDKFGQVLAPFVWTVTGANVETVQGNGLNEIHSTYEKPGSYSATLSVDGNTINCGEVQVQGIPISIESCKPNKASVYAGETIVWTVVEKSESPITGHTWSSNNGTVTGTGVEGSMVAPTGIHKEKVSASVTVSNADNSAVKYACEGVTVLDPNHVDMELTVGDINNVEKLEGDIIAGGDELFIESNTPTIIKIPANAKNDCTIGCKPRVGSDFMSTKITFDAGEPVDNITYFKPAKGCAPGMTFTVTSSVKIMCIVNQN